MEHYVTLFDGFFLPQGLALHTSMERHVKPYVLWILCVDDAAHAALAALNLPNVQLLKLCDLETTDLLRVKPSRSKGEYCWTLTPFSPDFVFRADASIKRITYIDADLWFRKHPFGIFNELASSGKQVLITDHAYSPDNDQSQVSGQFCVQFMIFDRRSDRVRHWWQQKCIEWCFARSEDGKFGDQKYLDDWPERFSDLVHVLENKELALAPWNATRFPHGNSIFFHFHGVRIANSRSVDVRYYPLPQPLIKFVYKPYLQDLRAATEKLERAGVDWKPQAPNAGSIKRHYHTIRNFFFFVKSGFRTGRLPW